MKRSHFFVSYIVLLLAVINNDIYFYSNIELACVLKDNIFFSPNAEVAENFHIFCSHDDTVVDIFNNDKIIETLGGYYLSGGYLLFNVNVISNLNDNIRFRVNVIDVLNIFCSPSSDNLDVFNVDMLHSPNATMVGVPKGG